MTLIEQIKDLINRVENGVEAPVEEEKEIIEETKEETEQVENAEDKEDIEDAFTEALAEIIIEQ